MPRNDPLPVAAPAGGGIASGSGGPVAPNAKPKPKPKPNVPKTPKAKTAVQEATSVSCLDLIFFIIQ